MTDYPKKYWWLVLIALPIVIALISIAPSLLDKAGKENEESTHTPSVRPPIGTTPEPVPPRQPGHSDTLAVEIPTSHSTDNTSDGKLELTVPPSGGPEIVRSSGVGLAPADIRDPARRSALARRAAEVIAMRNLAEAIRGAVIESLTEVRDGELSEDLIRVKVNTVLKLAHKVKEIEHPDGRVEVIMEAPVQQQQ